MNNIDAFLKICSEICACEGKKDINKLYLIYRDILNRYSKDSSAAFKDCLDMLMTGIIQVAYRLQKVDDRCVLILKEMSVFSNPSCRLAVCGCVDDYSIFLQDKDERVVNLARIRDNFEAKYENEDEVYKNQLSFLTSLLETGLISVMQDPLSDTLIYQSNLFATESDDSFSLPYENSIFDFHNGVRDDGFSVDAFRFLLDQRIIASYILFLIHSGVIKIKSSGSTGQILTRLQPKRIDIEE